MSDPDVDRYNLRAGTQTFGPLYQFTGETTLVETAEAIHALGSDTIKFYLGSGFSRQYDISLPSSITNLLSLAKNEPSCRRVLDMPFRHFIVWAYCFTPGGDVYWADGLSATERTLEYNELYGFARYLLTNYNNSGKSFYLGHWEGDWYLLPGYVTTNNPSPTTLQGMRDWMNLRQQAVDDAKRDTPHANVNVFAYTEANRVRDAMVNGTNSNQRVINMVVPYVTNLDCVSWSSYDGQNLSQTDLFSTLDYMESMLPTNKAGTISGKRIFIGEYGWGGSYSSADQEPRTRAYLQKLLQWGCPFILFWEMYNNEVGRSFWLIDDAGTKTPCWFLHQRFYNRARLLLAEFKQNNGRLPNDAEFATLVTPLLNQPLPAPVSLLLEHGPVTAATTNSATISGTLTQGIYREDWASVFVGWGLSDGGTNKAAWEHIESLGQNSRFGPAGFSTNLNSILPGHRYYFRFHATNTTGEGWSPASGAFITSMTPSETLVPAGAVWKYYDQNIDLGTAWRAPDYNDSSWASGPAQLGFGDGDEATVINANRLRITTYFRRAFTVTNSSWYSGLNLRLLRDDGAVVYLNGNEVFRSNMPTGAITAATYASSTVTGGDEFTNFYSAVVSPALLRTGTNVLAVEVHQRDTNSSDLSFDLELTAASPQPQALTEQLIPIGSMWKYLDNGSNQGTNWARPEFNDSTWASGLARLGYGGDGELTTVNYGPNSASKYITTYFRGGFEIAAPLVFERLTVRAVADDGLVVFLNGVEVFRNNMPAGTAAYTTTAVAALSGADEFILLQRNVPLSLLRVGRNVVAAEVHQSSGGSSDLGFDLEVDAEYTALPDGLPLNIARASSQAVVTWPRPATGISLQAAAQMQGGAWNTVTNAPVVLGPNNAVAVPTARTQEFFRLRSAPVDASTLTGKQLFGYQGWFASPLDGAPPNRWIHWFRSQTPVATNATVDFWPDISELEPNELFATAMTLPSGQPARVYSPHKQKTVMRHFRWMQEHGVDGVFLQRFTSELGSRDLFEWRNRVALNVRAGAEAYGRVFAMMYDISGQNSNTLVATLQGDWQYLATTLRLTNSSRYLRHTGRPVVAVWGLGFTDRPGTPQDAQQVIDFFHTNGCTVLGGVPTNWRTLDGDSKTDPAWANVYRAFDIISPWAVGRFSTEAGADSFKTSKIVPDLAAARTAGRDYLPVVWPGFSWRNLNNGPLNQIPRNGGRFYWRQVYNAVSAGCTMLYGAVFDEMDEGTAMFKLAPTAAQLPAQGTFVPLNIDGYPLPSDWYLRLAGEAGRTLRGELPLSPNLPINP